jgi:hypothetical protein
VFRAKIFLVYIFCVINNNLQNMKKKMIKQIIFTIILSIKFIKCIKVTDFCYQIKIENREIECKQNSKYKYDCMPGLCSVDPRYSCQSIKLFSTVKDIQKNEKDYIFFRDYYQLFLSKIRDCTEPPKYKWNQNDLCVNIGSCLQTTFWRIWSTLFKQGECKCRGKYIYKCNKDYCASDKRACKYLKHKVKSEIKKC